MKKIRLLLAEDHTIVREGLRSLIDSSEDMEVVGEVGDGREALKKVEEIELDIVLMDIRMPGLNGIQVIAKAKELSPDTDAVVDVPSGKLTVTSAAVVPDGTALLGLRDIGPAAALPVMEGKAVLYKKFGGYGDDNSGHNVCLSH